MKLAAKVILYLALVALATLSLRRVRSEFENNRMAELRLGQELAPEPRDPEPAPEDGAVPGPGLVTNAVGTVVTNRDRSEALTVATNQLKSTPAANRTGGGAAITGGVSAKKAPRTAMGGWIAGFVIALLSLAGLASWDVAHWFAGRTNQALGVDGDTVPTRDPEYDAAEAEWGKGNHLDAINLMREYLNKNPNEQYVALRIAEIYEKDLGNYLAAALEYEEVLNHKLPREKWGWTALRLSNLYSGRLNQPDRAISTLERVTQGYAETAAAKKARERLGIPEPTEEPVGEMDVNPIGPAPVVPEDPTLPAGFRRKK